MAAEIPEAVVKHEAKKKMQKSLAERTKAKAKEKAKDVVVSGKRSARRAVTSAKRGAKNSKFNPTSKYWRAPASYSVRKQHSLLVSMWVAFIAIWVFAYFASRGQMSGSTFWKRGIAIHFVFMVLSLFVMSETFAPAVGMLSVVVVLAVAMSVQNYLMDGMAAIVLGLNPPIGSNATGKWVGNNGKPLPVSNNSTGGQTNTSNPTGDITGSKNSTQA